MFSTKSQFRAILGLVLLSFVLSLVPYVNLVLEPINTFVTAVHEMSHAIACVVTGGEVGGMTIVSDGEGHGGLTFCQGGIPFIYSQAGYLGTAIFGCLLLFLSRYHKISTFILVGIGVIISLASVGFMGAGVFHEGHLLTLCLAMLAGMVVSGLSGFGAWKLLCKAKGGKVTQRKKVILFGIAGALGLGTVIGITHSQALSSMVWGFLIGALFIIAGTRLSDEKANLVLLFIAVQTALNALTGVATVVLVSFLGVLPADGSARELPWSDASNMATMMGIAKGDWLFKFVTLGWSLFWAVCAVAMFLLTLWWLFKLDKKSKSLDATAGLNAAP